MGNKNAEADKGITKSRKKTSAGMKLVIVESPTKARTIGAFLGKGYKVESSFGHVRDLPKSKLGIDTEHDFEPQYIVPMKARKNLTVLKKTAAKADEVILATDEDREGEAIAWHLSEALGLDKVKSQISNLKNKAGADEIGLINTKRIVFHEITKTAIQEALTHPRPLDVRLVDAQQARRVLDRLVGYKLSPFLWKKVFRGLSAGRVQSAALRLIADREAEREAFKKEEYWTISALFETDSRATFEAALSKIDGAPLEKLAIRTEDDARRLARDIEASACTIDGVVKKRANRNPLPPFTTSTLQQEASKRLRLSARQTMRFAQSLYENGHITYMRTDSVNLSQESLGAARAWITGAFGERYVLPAPRMFSSKSRLAQEAHEAIRPTTPSFAPREFGGTADDALPRPEARLYALIWSRFIASQLPPAVFDATTIEVLARGAQASYGLKATGTMLVFDGFLKVWKMKISEKDLPEVREGEGAEVREVKPEQHFTEPPPRYNEASLVKALEEFGIGRPSTYAPIISVIQMRNYVEKDEQRRFVPTETGVLVNSLLKEHFPDIVDIGFTAEMEKELDEIAEGNKAWREVIRTFYTPFSVHLEKKYAEVEKTAPPVEATDEICEKCGKPMVVKMGRFGKFLACSGFPECKSTKKLLTAQNSFGPCPECKEGTVIMRRTKTRRTFYGCSRYPECKYASWTRPGAQNVERGTGSVERGA